MVWSVGFLCISRAIVRTKCMDNPKRRWFGQKQTEEEREKIKGWGEKWDKDEYPRGEMKEEEKEVWRKLTPKSIRSSIFFYFPLVIFLFSFGSWPSGPRSQYRWEINRLGNMRKDFWMHSSTLATSTSIYYSFIIIYVCI